MSIQSVEAKPTWNACPEAHKLLTDFIVDSACLAAEQTLLDQRLFMANGKTYQALLDLLDRPARSNAGLKDLFSHGAVGAAGYSPAIIAQGQPR
jgi:hypothetical protein